MHPNPCCPGPVSSQSSCMRNSVTLIRSRKQSVQCFFSMGNKILSFLTHIVKTCTHYAQWRATSTCQRRWIIMSFSLMKILSNHLGNSYRSYRNSTRIIISRKAKANHQKAPKKKPPFSKRVQVFQLRTPKSSQPKKCSCLNRKLIRSIPQGLVTRKTRHGKRRPIILWVSAPLRSASQLQPGNPLQQNRWEFRRLPYW